MSLSIIPGQLIKDELFSKLTAKELATFTTANKALYQLRSSDPRWADSRWQQKIQALIQQGKGFRLAGFDGKTLYLINKTNIEKEDKITQCITIGSSLVLVNFYLINAMQTSFPSTELVDYYCNSYLTLLSHPNFLVSGQCYLAGYCISYVFQTLKIAGPVAIPCLIFPKQFVEFLVNQLEPAYRAKLKVFTYLKNSPDIPNRTLPLYARCFAKGVQCFEKAKHSVTSAVGSFYSRHIDIGSTIDLQPMFGSETG